MIRISSPHGVWCGKSDRLLGEHHLAAGRKDAAAECFKKCTGSGKRNSNECRFAAMELENL